MIRKHAEVVITAGHPVHELLHVLLPLLLVLLSLHLLLLMLLLLLREHHVTVRTLGVAAWTHRVRPVEGLIETRLASHVAVAALVGRPTGVRRDHWKGCCTFRPRIHRTWTRFPCEKKEFLLTSPFSKRSIERKPFVPGHNPGVCFKIFVPADYSHMVLKYFVFFLKRNAAT